jgi:hypothetical protein
VPGRDRAAAAIAVRNSPSGANHRVTEPGDSRDGVRGEVATSDLTALRRLMKNSDRLARVRSAVRVLALTD